MDSPESSIDEQNIEDLVKENNVLTYDSQCVRKKSNWSRPSNVYKFDSGDFEPKTLLNDVSARSPKLDALLQKIATLDANDMRKDGKMYKHFIFSDIKSGGYGAKLVASALIAKGFQLGYTAPRIGETPESAVNSVLNNILPSISSSVKPASKPESTPLTAESTPLTAESESKAESTPTISTPSVASTVGTAITDAASSITSTLSTALSPSGPPPVIEGEGKVGGADDHDSDDEEKQTKKIWRKMRLLTDTELQANPNKNFYLLSSIGVYNQPINVTTKKAILKKFNQRPENINGEEARIIVMDSGFKEGIDLFDIKYIHIFEPQRTGADLKQVIGRGTRTCGQKGLTFHPTKGWPLYVYIYDLSIPEQLRTAFLGTSSVFDLYLKSLNIDLRLFNFMDDLEKISILGSVDYELNKKIHNFSIESSPTSASKGGGKRKIIINTEKLPIYIDEPNSLQDRMIELERMALLEPKNKPEIVAIKPLKKKPKIVIHNPNPLIVDFPMINNRPLFQETREHIKEHFSQYAWADVKMENMCAEAPASKGGTSQVIKFTPTQDFIRNYFTPANPCKGLLLWHSVGTGKTCSAIAAASGSFERQGYTILWVTRSTLKTDIWKNMFDQVCNESIRSIMKHTKIPEIQAQRMRLLSKSWRIRPISYKQFTNLVSKQNSYYKTLVKINGQVDPLRKTLIIIDEAHKLYGETGMSSLERPDMNALHAALMHSYRVSGAESVRLMLMTATPMTEDPMEFIKLLNLCKPMEEQMPNDFSRFSQEYLDESGKFSENGQAKYLDDIAGYVSYLNREKDARQFSQPIVKTISPPLVEDPEQLKRFDRRFVRDYLNTDIIDLKKKVIEENAKIDTELKNLESSKFGFLNKKCEGIEDSATKKQCAKIVRENIRDLVKEAKAHAKHIREGMDAIRGEIKNKSLFKKDALQKIKDNLETDEEGYEEFKKTAYYNLKYKCGKNVNTNDLLQKALSNHPDVAKVNAEIVDYDIRIQSLERDLKTEIQSYQSRIKRMKEMLKTDLTDLEKSVIRMTIRDEQKTIRRMVTLKKKETSNKKKAINETRKAAEKKKTKRMKTIKKIFKTNLRETKKEENATKRDLARAEKQLKKALRKQGQYDEEINNEVLKGLVTKYTDKIDAEYSGMQVAVAENARAKQEKAEMKAQLKAEKVQANQTRKIQKAQDKAQDKERKALEKTQEKERKALEKAQKQTLKKSLKQNNKTKKIVVKGPAPEPAPLAQQSNAVLPVNMPI